MLNFNKHKISHGGKGSREKTRDELLAEIKAERAERGEVRKRAQAAISIQRNWRGHCARNQVCALLTAQCLERLSTAQSFPLSAQEIAGFLLPRLLFLFLPSAPATAAAATAGIHSHAPLSAPVQPSTLAPAAGVNTSKAAPGGCSSGVGVGGGGGGGAGAAAAAAQLKLIRGALAALIYSLSSPRPENNYVALPHERFDHQQEQEQQQQQQQQGQGQQQRQNLQHQQQQLWWRQCARLQHLCCVLVGRGDAIMDAAAVRILALLTDHTQSKLAIDQEAKAHVSASLLQQVTCHLYTPLFQALGRVLANKAVVSSTGQSADACSARQASKDPAAQVAGPVLHRMLSLVLTALQANVSETRTPDQQPRMQQQQQCGLGASLPHNNEERPAAAAADAFVRIILVMPGAVEQLPPDMKAQLRTPHMLHQLCCSFRASSSCLDGLEALWGLANCTLLVAGNYTTLVPEDTTQHTRPVLHGPPAISTPQVALAYAHASCSLLQQCMASPFAHSLIQSTVSKGPTGEVSYKGGDAASAAKAKTQLMQGPGEGCLGVWGGSGVHHLRSSIVAAGGVESWGRAVCSLWPLAQRSFILQLLNQLLAPDNQAGSGVQVGASGAVLYSGLYSGALQLTQGLDKELRARGHLLSSEVPSMLSTLAFAPGILPSMWKWLATNVGLPLEAPKGATRGLDIAALWPGYSGLAQGHALVLGLFCKLYNHLLMVLDDGEFYEECSPKTSTGPVLAATATHAKGGNLSLSQVRAIVTSLNSLVFHSHLPRALPTEQQHHHHHHQNQNQQGDSHKQVVSSAVAAAGGDATVMLTEAAPLLLRSLYERDARRPFCQPLVWLAPYTEMFGDAAVAPAMHAPTMPEDSDEEEEEEEEGADAGTVRVGGYPAAVVLQSLVRHPGVNSGARSGDDEEEEDVVRLQCKARPGARPSAVAALLLTAPQCVPFARRVDLFRALLVADMRKHGFNRPVYQGGVPPIKVTIRRGGHMMNDAYTALAGLGPSLRARVHVTFINEQGLSEAGLDQGGLMKEFLEEVVVRGFNADYGLFTTTSEGLLFPCPSADKLGAGLQLLEFLGTMVGKALYEGMLINVAFAPFFISRLQGRTPMFDDLRTLDPELHRSLLMVKNYEGDVSDLGLTFSTTDDFFGLTTQHALLPGHGNTPVTNENRLLYCHLLADWHLNVRLGRPAEAFARGLAQLIPTTTLRLFNPKEFNQLVSGDSEDGGGGVDVDDLRRHSKYGGGYRPDSSAVDLFWKVVSEFSPAERGLLLKFVTSCSRAPLGGFKYLHPPFLIHKVECEASFFASLPGTHDVDRLPSASTCYNTLKLPNYRRKDTMRKKILHAITSNAGFELS